MRLDERTTLEKMTRTIVDRFRPERLVLFGSRARGDNGPGSDFDLLMIAPSDRPRLGRSVPVFAALAGSGVSKDIVWWTPEEVEEWRGVKSHFINTALSEGVTLYDKPTDHAWALWKQAENDLFAARTVLETGRALDTVCFHAQQAAEKSLKVVARVDVEYPRRHDLGELLSLVGTLATDLDLAGISAIELAPFAVQVRYETGPEPTPELSGEALKIAEAIPQEVGRWIESRGS